MTAPHRRSPPPTPSWSRSTAELQQATDDQSQFLAVTAHELRTPIGRARRIRATCSPSTGAELTDEERDGLLEAMTTGTTRLRRLLDDLLTASRLQASALEMRAGGGRPVGDVVREAVTTVRRTHPDAEIVVDVPPGITVHADRDRLAQALDNLLNNALRHGVPPPVRRRLRPARVEIRVTDQGPGVSAAMQPRLFDRFATGAATGGTGLGLFIVRELARAQGGDAFYELAPAETSAGDVRHRSSRWLAPRPDRRRSRLPGPGTRPDRRTATQRERRAASVHGGASTPRHPRLRNVPIAVLLVDDVEDVRRMVRTALRLRGGFEVVGEASSGAEAVRLADGLHPDIVVLDLGLPDIAGREVLTRIRSHSPGSRVVVFTGMEPHDQEWIAGQVEGYLGKDAELRLPGGPPRVARPAAATEAALDLPHELTSVAMARRFVSQQVTDWQRGADPGRRRPGHQRAGGQRDHPRGLVVPHPAIAHRTPPCGSTSSTPERAPPNRSSPTSRRSTAAACAWSPPWPPRGAWKLSPVTASSSGPS